MFVAFLISVNNDLKEKKVVREIILNEEKIEKICFLESLISSRMVREYEKDKILAWRYDTLLTSEYKLYLERLGYYYEKKCNFRERIKEIIQRYQLEPDRWEMYNYVNTYDMIYRNINNVTTAQNTTTTASWQWEYDSAWTTTFQYYRYPKEEKKEDKKIDPNKEIIKHLTKICKNKKWV